MTDGGPTAPQPPPTILPVIPPTPPVHLPAPLTQLIVPPAQLTAPNTKPIQPAPMLQLNQSHFKPDFAGNPNNDVEAHLLRTNDWMDTHASPEGVKVQDFCLTLAGEVRL